MSQTIDIPVDKDQSSFQYEAEPFTEYTSQVLAELNVNGAVSTLPITAPATVESGESGNDNETIVLAYNYVIFLSLSV